jgi:acid phosphatase type 7
MQRGSAPVARLLLATLLAGAGAVLVLVGLAAVLRTAGADHGATGATGVGETSGRGTPALESPTPGASASGPAGGAGASLRPTPLPAEVVLVGAGDIGRCDATTDDDTASLAETLPGIVFTLGDNAYGHGSESDYRDCFGGSWGRFEDRIELPVPGNHDYDTDGAAGYRAYFGDRAAREGTTWYSRDVGAWHVVVLDSNCDRVDGGCGEDSAQVRWLRDDLAASRARCTLALFHHPRFSSGEHGSDQEVAPFWEALYEDGADLVLNGHDHDYERFAPQDPNAQPDEDGGIMELVVGTGGADLRRFHDPIANSRVREAVAHGVIELGLSQTGWRWQFHSTDGSFTDAGADRCH